MECCLRHSYGEGKDPAAPSRAIWDETWPVVSSDWSHTGGRWTICLSRTLPQFLVETAWTLGAVQTQLTKMCNYILSFGSANIYVKWLYILQCFTKFKAANHWWKGVSLGSLFYNSTSFFYFRKTDLAETSLSPDTSDGCWSGLTLTAPGLPAPVTLSSQFWDFEQCCPTGADILTPEKR